MDPTGDPLDQAVFLIQSAVEGNIKSGSGFALARWDVGTLFATCAHVVSAVGGPDQVRVSGLPARVLALGDPKGNDLALLEVPGLTASAYLATTALGQTGAAIRLCGYGPFAEAHKKRALGGSLGQLNQVTPGGGAPDYRLWELTVEDSNFARLAGGYSGGPVVDARGRLVGIGTAREDDKLGYALCVSNLWRLPPTDDSGIDALLAGVARPEDDRFARIRTGLKVKAEGLDKAQPGISARIAAELDRLESLPALDTAEETRLVLLEVYASGAISSAHFVFIWSSQSPAAGPAVASGPDYPRLAGLLRRGDVALLLGPDLAHQSGYAVTGAADLPESLAGQLTVTGLPAGRCLAEVCERVELDPDGCGRTALARGLLALATPAGAAASAGPDIYRQIAEIDRPLVLISAAYDGLLEAALAARGRRCVTLAPPPRGDRNRDLILSYSAPAPGLPLRCGREALSGLGLHEAGWTLVYRLRGLGPNGTAADSLLLSERDYFQLAAGPEPPLPDYLVSLLRDRHLWLLGYGLHAWDDRLLARTVLGRRAELGSSRDILAVHPSPDGFARHFWRQPGLGVQLLVLPLPDFVAGLWAVP
jgi:hypothetical protein